MRMKNNQEIQTSSSDVDEMLADFNIKIDIM